jgi:hypothetical protein
MIAYCRLAFRTCPLHMFPHLWRIGLKMLIANKRLLCDSPYSVPQLCRRAVSTGSESERAEHSFTRLEQTRIRKTTFATRVTADIVQSTADPICRGRVTTVLHQPFGECLDRPLSNHIGAVHVTCCVVPQETCRCLDCLCRMHLRTHGCLCL